MASSWPWTVPGPRPAPKPLIGEYSFSVVIRKMHLILSLVLANFNSLRVYWGLAMAADVAVANHGGENQWHHTTTNLDFLCRDSFCHLFSEGTSILLRPTWPHWSAAFDDIQSLLANYKCMSLLISHLCNYRLHTLLIIVWILSLVVKLKALPFKT